MKSLVLAVFVSTLAFGSMSVATVAQAADTCQSQAVGKDGKPLAGAAKTSFMKKCMADSCSAKAVGKDGKPLAGAAKTAFMKKCQAAG